MKNIKLKVHMIIVKVKNLDRRSRIKLIAGILVVAIIVLVLVCVQFGSSDDGRAAGVVTNRLQLQKIAKLNHIESQLTSLTTEIRQTNDPSKQEMVGIAARLTALQKSVANLATDSGIREVKDLVKDGDKNLSDKVNDLSALVKKLRKQFTPVTYLKESVLPFKPMSVDIWNGVPYVTVKLDGQAALVGVNEIRSGWTVTKLDYEAQEVVFKNDKNQFVKACIQG